MIKYATANCSMCSRARTSCSVGLGRMVGGGVVAGGGAVAVFVDTVGLWPLGGDVGAEEDERHGAGAGDEAVVDASVGDRDRYWCRSLARRMMNASYSRPMRRRNSRISTRQMTPMQEPANSLVEVMCQVEERKPFSCLVGVKREGDIVGGGSTGVNGVPVP